MGCLIPWRARRTHQQERIEERIVDGALQTVRLMQAGPLHGRRLPADGRCVETHNAQGRAFHLRAA